MKTKITYLPQNEVSVLDCDTPKHAREIAVSNAPAYADQVLVCVWEDEDNRMIDEPVESCEIDLADGTQR